MDNGWPESEYLCVLGLVLFVIGRWICALPPCSLLYRSEGQVKYWICKMSLQGTRVYIIDGSNPRHAARMVVRSTTLPLVFIPFNVWMCDDSLDFVPLAVIPGIMRAFEQMLCHCQANLQLAC